MTETGMSLGTPHYMSPEQATADKEITGRSDVYSLASVLYEMLAGQPPHLGGSAQQIIMKIIAENAAPVTRLRKSVPPNVAAAVDQALEKLPADRFESAKAFAEALTNPAFRTATGAAAAGGTAQPPNRLTTAPAILAGTAILAAALAAWGWLRPPPPAGPVVRFTVKSEGGDVSGTLTPAISPDGRTLVLPTTSGGAVIRRLDAVKAAPIPGFENIWSPFFSPDGASLGFTTGFPGDLVVLGLSGGAALTVVHDSAMAWGGTWSDAGWLYFTNADGAALMRVRPSGGPAEVVARVDTTKDELFIRWPEALPGGRGILVSLWRKRGTPDIALVDVDRGELRVLRRGIRAFYAATGHLIVVQGDGSVVAQPFDAKSGRPTGDPVEVLEHVRTTSGGTVQFALSANGTMAYSRYRPAARVVRVTRAGRATVVDPSWTSGVGGLALSPDGKRLALDQTVDDRAEIWVKTLDAGPITRIVSGGSQTYRPFWSPDGRWVGFLSDMNGAGAAYRAPSDGSGTIELIARSPKAVDEGAWSRDGQWLLLRLGAGGGRDVYAMHIGVDSIPKPILATPADEYSPALSPDGRWLAYGSNANGKGEVYVRSFPNGEGGQWQISIGGGEEPAWSHSGHELFYRAPDGMLVSAAIGADPGFHVVSRQRLFSALAYHNDDRHRGYAVEPDDQSFLFVDPQDPPSGELTVVLNWFEELRRVMKDQR
jgi:serine/threonine-protein kinase